MINLCLVVIATQFSETKKREMERMLIERKRFHSSSTLASNSEPGGCYDEMIKYISHLVRKSQRKLNRFLRRTAHARRRVTPERAVSMTLQPRRKRRKKRDQENEPSFPYKVDPNYGLQPTKHMKSNVDSPHATLDSLEGAELGISTGPQRPAFLHVNNASIGFPSVISLFSSNSLPTPPPTLRLCSPPYISHMSSVSSDDFSGKYLLVPLEIIRTSNRQPVAGMAGSVNEKPGGKMHTFSRAASLNCETCGGNYLPVVQIEDGRRRNSISRAASMVSGTCGNNLPVPNEGARSRRNSIMRAVSLSTEPCKNYLPVPKEGNAERRNSFTRAASINSDPCKTYLPIPGETSKARRNSISRAASLNCESSKILLPVPAEPLGTRRNSIGRAASLNSEPLRSCLSVSKDLPPAGWKNSVNQEASEDCESSKNYLPVPGERVRHNSISRAASLSSGDVLKKYLPLPPDGNRSRRNSISRASSLNSGQCGNHLSVPQELIRKRENSVSRMGSLCSDKCTNYLSVPGESVGKRRQSISRALSLNTRGQENSSLIGQVSLGNKINILDRNLPKQRISVIRASSFCSESCGKYLPLPRDAQCRRSSIGRAASLNSGTCGKYEALSLDKTGRCRSAVVASSNARTSNDYLNKIHHRSMHTVKFHNKGQNER